MLQSSFSNTFSKFSEFSQRLNGRTERIQDPLTLNFKTYRNAYYTADEDSDNYLNTVLEVHCTIEYE